MFACRATTSREVAGRCTRIHAPPAGNHSRKGASPLAVGDCDGRGARPHCIRSRFGSRSTVRATACTTGTATQGRARAGQRQRHTMPRRTPPIWWHGTWWWLSEDGQSWGFYSWSRELHPVTVVRPEPPGSSATRGEYLRGFHTEWRFVWVWRWTSYEEARGRRAATLQQYRSDVLAGRREPVTSSDSSSVG